MRHVRLHSAAFAATALLVAAWTDSARADDTEEEPAPASAPAAPAAPAAEPRVGPVDQRRPSVQLRESVQAEPRHADPGLIVGGSLLLTAGLFWDFVGVVGVVGEATYQGGDFSVVPGGALGALGAVGFAIGLPCTIGGIWLIVDGAHGSPEEPVTAVGQAPSVRWQVAPTAAAFEVTF